MTSFIPEKFYFETVPNDPINTRIYTLANGLKLFLSVNKDEPRIYTEIAVRAGSKHDPAETTGLAHYFEHMMFKGTDRLGSLNWEAEKQLLDQIEQLFEIHRAEQDPDKKRALYAEIDRLSYEAAKFAAANEYDKMVGAIGAKGTNAYTWVEQTVYVNDIPSNELERWFELESERFRRPVLRLFHTELETVFEEYNIAQDRDFRKVSKAVQEILTPSHPYGTQTTLGRGEDLKNPSQTNIYRFFDKYYVPNNMAIILCGDFDPKEAVILANRYFGHFQPKTIPPFEFPPQPELSGRIQRDVFGNEAPWVEMAWRFPAAASEISMVLPMISGVLHNNQAGLFDLNLVQQQKVLEAYAYLRIHEDFCALVLHAKPREGQSHADVEALLIAEIIKLQKGDYEDWLPEAVLKDLKFSEVKEFEKNQGRAGALTHSFILGMPWSQTLRRWEILENCNRENLSEFSRQYLRTDNYAVVYKHTGPDSSVMKVEKPAITAIEVNRSDMSEFAESFLQKETEPVEPVFVDFSKRIKTQNLAKNLPLRVVHDREALMFRLHYTFNMGRTSDRRLNLAANYLPYLGTSKYSASQMQQAFYRLGVHFSASCQDDNFYFSLTGLEESLEAGIELMEHLLADAQPNREALDNLIADILLRRENDKKDKRAVLTKGLYNYAKYGPVSPFSDKLSREQLLALQPEELTGLLKSLSSFRHEAFYYGSLPAGKIAGLLKKHHPIQAELPPLKPKIYRERRINRDQVYFLNFPMVQVEIMLLSKGTPNFNLEEFIFSEWYNQYFGYGLSSIVFQEIRESKALAYSAYAYAANPIRKRRAHFLQAYVGTQPDKLYEAVDTFQKMLENMPVSESQIENARQSVLKQIAASRIIKSDIYWSWRANRERGFKNHDLRRDIYETLDQASATELMQYQEKYIRGRKYTWLVLGERERIDFDFLKKIGPVKELSLEEVFGY